MFKRVSIIIYFLLFFMDVSAASSIDEAQAFLDKDEYQKAYNILLPLANNDNDPKGQILYANILNVWERPKEAIPYVETLARTGLSDAQHLLGILYLSPSLISNHSEDGIYWLKKSAEQDNLLSLEVLALTAEGIGNYNNAFSYRAKASELGDIKSTHIAATLLLEHDLLIEVPFIGTDIDIAKFYLRKAVTKGYADSQYLLGEIYLEEDK